MPRKPTDQIQLKLRFDERLRRRLEQAAARNNHSMNAEIISRLEQSFRDADILTKIQSEHASVMDKMKEVLGKTEAVLKERIEDLFKQYVEEEAAQAAADAQEDYSRDQS
ncbi:MAG: Arc family DNA-binding protein [Rhizobiales bacterium]|nr:Arc family DNA-binding protein [Hyphomicrobiales bacterium]